MVNLNHEILINEVYASPRGLVFAVIMEAINKRRSYAKQNNLLAI